MVRQWRNSPLVAVGMITNHTITVDEHQAWLRAVLTSTTSRHWVICAGGRPVGLVHLSAIDRVQRHCTWGFYNAVMDLRGHGVMVAALTGVLDHAFGELGMDVVNAEVLDGNDASLAVHRRLGFEVTDRRRGAVRRDATELDVIVLQLQSTDWRERDRRGPTLAGS